MNKFQFRVGTLDGEIVNSDVVTYEELQAEIDAVDGRVGSGEASEMRVENVEDFLAFMEQMIYGGFGEFTTRTLNVPVDGQVRTIKNYAWARIVRL